LVLNWHAIFLFYHQFRCRFEVTGNSRGRKERAAREGTCHPGPVLFVLRTNGWHSGVDPTEVWQHLPTGPRAAAVAGFIGSAYGLGAILNHLLTRAKA